MKIGEAVIERNKLRADEAPDCQKKNVDGGHCARPGTNIYGGYYVCGLHLNRLLAEVEQRTLDLARYEDYQKSAFGGLAMTLSDDDLAARQRDLMGIVGDEDDLHFRRLRAERDAIEADLKRRREG